MFFNNSNARIYNPLLNINSKQNYQANYFINPKFYETSLLIEKPIHLFYIKKITIS